MYTAQTVHRKDVYAVAKDTGIGSISTSGIHVYLSYVEEEEKREV